MTTALRTGAATNMEPVNDAPPFYLPAGNEVELFIAAHQQRLPVMLKGPTGVGKTRFIEAMASKLGRQLITVACHEDLSAADLVGRFLLEGDATAWVDGPLTKAVREGAICYLDEVVEARQDTTVVLHALTDHRRMLPVERLNITLPAPPEFQLVVSYNPGYQSLLKDLKDSTRQRMVGIELTFPSPEVELQVPIHESGLDADRALELVRLAAAIRRVESGGLREVASPRTLITAGQLMASGVDARSAVWAALAVPLTDDRQVAEGLRAMIDNYIA
ncbi:CbbQ/NirQ/NorQ/GpvN family protein [Mycobacterium sp.]|uniref:CbbQ/NirQ/NorQ/GpvN family protein n=1 Tax=Mycobacterium sp. TaxID=1785 RepID=UPI003D0CA28E